MRARKGRENQKKKEYINIKIFSIKCYRITHLYLYDDCSNSKKSFQFQAWMQYIPESGPETKIFKRQCICSKLHNNHSKLLSNQTDKFITKLFL